MTTEERPILLSELPAEPSVANVDERVRRALASDRTIDITTTGRRSGQPRRIEIWFHNLGGRIYISGLPGSRGVAVQGVSA
jgi:hypothetical protein